MPVEWELHQKFSIYNSETKDLETDKAHFYCDILMDFTHIWMEQTNQKINSRISPSNSFSFSTLLPTQRPPVFTSVS